MPSSHSLQASALSFAALSIGHTLGGSQLRADPNFARISGTRAWACGVVGWYQGTALFLATNLIHYQWSRNPRALREPTNTAIAIVINAMMWSSSAWYFRHGIRENGWVVGLGAMLQTWAVVRAWIKY